MEDSRFRARQRAFAADYLRGQRALAQSPIEGIAGPAVAFLSWWKRKARARSVETLETAWRAHAARL